MVEVGSVSGRVSWAKIDEEDGTLKHIAGEKVAGFIPSNNVLGEFESLDFYLDHSEEGRERKFAQ